MLFTGRELILIGWDGPKTMDDINLINRTFFAIAGQGQQIIQIYSHLAFVKGGTDSTSDFHQTIWRRNKSTNEVLIVDSQIRDCRSLKKSTDPCYTSIVFSALRLRAGDHIYVTTSNNKDVIRNATCTFFGIYKLR